MKPYQHKTMSCSFCKALLKKYYTGYNLICWECKKCQKMFNYNNKHKLLEVEIYVPNEDKKYLFVWDFANNETRLIKMNSIIEQKKFSWDYEELEGITSFPGILNLTNKNLKQKLITILTFL